jgi:hypothetical protein
MKRSIVRMVRALVVGTRLGDDNWRGSLAAGIGIEWTWPDDVREEWERLHADCARERARLLLLPR